MADMTLNTAQVICLGDGRLAGPVDDIYLALNGLLNDNLMTHQLPDAGRYVEPFILEQHPWVATLPELNISERLDRNQAWEIVTTWVQRISDQHGTEHHVTDLSAGWTPQNPIEQLADKIGAERIIVVPQQPQQDAK